MILLQTNLNNKKFRKYEPSFLRDMNFEDVKKGKIKSACGTTINHSANVNQDELKNVLYIKKFT